MDKGDKNVAGDLYTYYDKNNAPIDIATSYDIQCSEQEKFASTTDNHSGMHPQRTAIAFCNRLNDLIEEYHAPGANRSDRRTIKREFESLANILLAHCRKYSLNVKFIGT